MARLAATRSSAQRAVDHADEALSLFLNPESDDPTGEERLDSMVEVELGLREAAISAQLAREAWEFQVNAKSGVLIEGEPSINDDDEDDDEESEGDAGDEGDEGDDEEGDHDRAG